MNKLAEILASGQPPAAASSSTAFRRFLEPLHYGDRRGVSDFYEKHREEINASKPSDPRELMKIN